MIQKIDHIVITTAKLSACLDFYKRLGFEVKEGGGRYELFAGDFKINVHIRGRELSPHAGTVQPGSGDLCFEITGGLAAFIEELNTAGIPIELGIVARTGVRGPMQSVYLRDPDENLLEISSYE